MAVSSRVPIDFAKEVKPGADPVAPSGALLISAAETEAKGSAISQAVNTDLLKTAGGVALDAAKGYLESSLEKDIKKTTESYETATNFDAAVTKYDALAGASTTKPADLQAAEAEVMKFQSALDQGVMTREQALLAIDKTVKDYSNILPGYASDLRKLATTVTGVQHMGYYKEYALLTQKSPGETSRELAAKNANELNMRMMNAFVDKYKRLPEGGLNGTDMAKYRAEALLEAKAADIKTQINLRDSNVTINEPKVFDYVNTKMSTGIMTLSQHLQGVTSTLDPKTGRPMAPENRLLIREQILSDVGTFFEGLKSEVFSLNSNQVSNAGRETILNRLNTQQKEMVTSLQNQDNFDSFKKIMSMRADQAKDVLNQWSIANPHLEIFRHSGMATPQSAMLWFDSQRNPARAAEFIRTYGKTFDNFYRAMTQDGVKENYVANARAMGTDPDHLGALAKTDPGQYQAQLHTLRDSISSVAKQGWGTTVETQTIRKEQFGTWLKSFANQIDPAKEDMVREWSKLVSDPAVAARIKELPEQAQLQAIEPIYTKTRELLENPEFGLFKRLSNVQRQLASSAFATVPIQIGLNPITNLFEVTSVAPKGTTVPKEFVDITPEGAAGQVYRQNRPAMTDTGAGRGRGEVKTLIDTINRSLTSLNNFKSVPGVFPEEMQKTGVNREYYDKFKAGFFDLNPVERDKALEKAAPVTEQEGIQRILDDVKDKYGSAAQVDAAARIRATDAKNDPVEIDNQIKTYQAAMADLAKRPKVSGEIRALIKDELALWKRAKELLSPKP